MSSTKPLETLNTLAAKPPQPALNTDTTKTKAGTAPPPPTPADSLPVRAPPTSKYADALAAAGASSGDKGAAGQAADKKPPEVPWRPRMDRQMSWNEQDQKHEMQQPMMSPSEGKAGQGFSQG